jgi:hypothetical protein
MDERQKKIMEETLRRIESISANSGAATIHSFINSWTWTHFLLELQGNKELRKVFREFLKNWKTQHIIADAALTKRYKETKDPNYDLEAARMRTEENTNEVIALFNWMIRTIEENEQ